MKYGIIIVPLSPVRKRANHRVEMVNQLFFGEAVKIIGGKEDSWLKIESLYDGYKGWITSHHIERVEADVALRTVSCLAPNFLTKIELNEEEMQIPLGASLINLDKKKGRISEKTQYTYSSKPINLNLISDRKDLLIRHALLWLNAPYLWGGKTILGVDCSGFCQTIYKLVGVPLLRDARQQALQGIAVKSLKNALPGDLVFFDDKEEIVHVGMMLGNGQIIHASGKVRIDKIDSKGIINVDTGKRTHNLKLIRRYLPFN